MSSSSVRPLRMSQLLYYSNRIGSNCLLRSIANTDAPTGLVLLIEIAACCSYCESPSSYFIHALIVLICLLSDLRASSWCYHCNAWSVWCLLLVPRAGRAVVTPPPLVFFSPYFLFFVSPRPPRIIMMAGVPYHDDCLLVVRTTSS